MRCSRRRHPLLLAAVSVCLALPNAASARTLAAESWGSRLASLDLGHPAPAARRAKRTKKRKRRRTRVRRLRSRSRRGFVQLADGRGLRVRDPQRAWGTRLTVDRLRQVATAYAARFSEDDPLYFHDVSHPRGGRMKPHRSHRNGRDVDIRLPLKGETKKYVNASPRTLHLERTWFLLKALADTCDVEFIFLDRRLQRALYRYARRQGTSRRELALLLQYPSRRRVGVIRHSKGHRNHIHVRFRHPRARTLQQAGREYCKQRRQPAEAPVPVS